MIGNGILLENSSTNTGIEESIKNSLKNLIINSYDDRTSRRLNMIQEEVSIPAHRFSLLVLIFQVCPTDGTALSLIIIQNKLASLFLRKNNKIQNK